ncbi:MAG: hypothetical protein HWN81_09415 [Candidatus Lokiarchaeota archaeon]|nr:hypothetical protein [Candidatus Lokiarchaeota archaeon]
MNKKELIAKILEKLSEEELQQLVSEEKQDQDEHKHVIKRRGSGHNKRKRKTKNNKNNNSGKEYSKKSPMIIENRTNKFEDFINSVSLDATEQKELAKASKEDEISRKNTSPKQKSKRPSTLIDVTCSVCRKNFNVSRNLVGSLDRWKCNSCCCQGR